MQTAHSTTGNTEQRVSVNSLKALLRNSLPDMSTFDQKRSHSGQSGHRCRAFPICHAFFAASKGQPQSFPPINRRGGHWKNKDPLACEAKRACKFARKTRRSSWCRTKKGFFCSQVCLSPREHTTCSAQSKQKRKKTIEKRDRPGNSPKNQLQKQISSSLISNMNEDAIMAMNKFAL